MPSISMRGCAHSIWSVCVSGATCLHKRRLDEQFPQECCWQPRTSKQMHGTGRLSEVSQPCQMQGDMPVTTARAGLPPAIRFDEHIIAWAARLTRTHCQIARQCREPDMNLRGNAPGWSTARRLNSQRKGV